MSYASMKKGPMSPRLQSVTVPQAVAVGATAPPPSGASQKRRRASSSRPS